MRVILWGTYDKGKPRTRIIEAALRSAGMEVIQIDRDVWDGIDDKSQLKGLRPRVRLLLNWLAAYPRLVVRYLRAPAHDAVVLTYPGHLDVLVLWPFARLRRRPIVWDAFLSLYDTVVLDRRLVSASHPIAWFVWGWEWLACRAASRVILDTEAHALFFRQMYGLPENKTAAAFVGAESEAFPPSARRARTSASDTPALTILFYGQFIPLHGIETIVRAAQMAAERPYRWVLVGSGQEEARIRRLLDEGPAARLEWIPWVPYDELIAVIDRADVCLGIFGDSGKAARVIPNKVFQILSAGKPLITRDSPAIRELLSEETRGVRLVPPADPVALLGAVEEVSAEMSTGAGEALHRAVCERFSVPALGAAWRGIIQATVRPPDAIRGRSGRA